MDIKRKIKEQGFSISQVAEALGVSQPSLSQQIAKGDSLSLSRLKEIASIIGTTATDLLEEDTANSFRCPHCGKTIYFGSEKK